MKKTVFLMLLLTFINVRSTIASTTTTYSFQEYEIRMTYMAKDGNRGYKMEKLGINPFSKELFYDDASIGINGIKEINGNHVLYGYILHRDTYALYDEFILILDQTGNELYYHMNEQEDLQEVVDIYVLDELLIIHTNYHVEEDREFKFIKNIFTTIDFQYNYVNSIETFSKYNRVIENEHLILLDIGNDTFIEEGLTSNLELIEMYDNLPIENESVFIDSVFIPFLNNAYLNGERVNNGIYLDYPGYYELVYNNFTYNFTVAPEVSGIEDNGVYNDPVTINLSSGNMMLNNDILPSGSTISNPGLYTLKITGANGYTKEYTFTITSSMEGILHNNTYTDSIDITFKGNGYLNNTFVESPIHLDTNGEYILKIQGENNYLETYYFTIEMEEDDLSFISFIQKYDFIFFIVVLISSSIFLKKK